jgi:ADP-ribosylglycohydrolase
VLGAIIGDVAGSYYEILEAKQRKNYGTPRDYDEKVKILDRNTPLFHEKSSCTDDSILTCAIYDAIVNGNCEYEKYLREYGLREYNNGLDIYGRGRFGHGFVKWLLGETEGYSYGNGASMRISPVGFLFDSMEEVINNARLATIPSHNDEDAIKGAESVATSIFLLRHGFSKKDVIDYIKYKYYPLDFDLEDLQRNYVFSSKTINSVPQALYVFSQSNDFEDAIRKAISIGGDSDTIACIVGSLAEACYGVSDELKEKVKPYLKDYMYNLLKDRYYNGKSKRYEKLNK